MAKGSGGFEGPRQVWSAPSPEIVKKNLRDALEQGLNVLSSHEPEVKEVHDAFTRLGDRLREAEEVLTAILKIQQEDDLDQEELNYALKGAMQTRTALIEAILLAKREIEK